MKKLVVLIGLFIAFFSNAQNDTLLFIGNEPILKEEFIRIYKKNNSPNVGEVLSVDDYLDLFIKYKLKVLAAKDAGYDTAQSFLKEYHKYVNLLAENYYPDSNVVNKLLKEAYQRSLTNVRVGYIILYLPKNFTPEDTLKVYQKALEIRKKLLDGADFYKTALEYSEHKDVKQNKGDAWYIDVFTLPYPLENFVYNHKKGEISMPIHRNQAYFILKVLDKKPAMGEIQVAHIYVRLPQNPSEDDSLKAMEKIKKIQEALKNGKSFDEVAKEFSDDKFTAVKGGNLGWIKPSSPLLTSFKEYAFSIKNVGDYVGPVRTAVGYHFIKLLDRKLPGSYKDEKSSLLKELKKKERYQIAIDSTTEKLKRKYHYKQMLPLSEIYPKIDENIFRGMWKADTFKNDNRILMKFADKEFTVADFGKFLEKHQKLQPPEPIDKYVQRKYKKFVEAEIKKYELPKLPQQIPQLKFIAQEYYDGILLFNITQDSISNVSIKDTAGLRKFYLQNKTKYYERLNLKIYSYSNKKGLKTALKLLKKGVADSILIKKTTQKDTAFKLEAKGIYQKGDNKIADKIFNLYEQNKIDPNKNYIILPDDKKLVVIKDNFKYVRGFVLADYQNYLEEKWIERLKKKYPVKINKKVLEQVKKELNQ